MTPTTLLILGLELTRFAANDDNADALGGSLDALQSGGWTLSPYEGPALQPMIAVRRGALELGLAPALASRSETASSADGREGTVRVVQYRVEGRVRYVHDPWFIGLDGAWSDGSATLDGDPLAQGTGVGQLGPTAGVRAPLAQHLDLSLRARWPVRLQAGVLSHGLGGALALEWHS